MSDGYVNITPERGLDLSGAARLGVVAPLLKAWIVRDTRARYRQSVLNASWTFIQPVVILLTYGWVLSTVLNVSSEGLPYLSFAWAGLVPFTFLQQAFGQGVGSLQQAGPLISRVYFPREVVPLSVVGCALVDLAFTTALLIIVGWVQVGPPTVHLAALLAVDVVLILWVSALTLIAASVSVFRRDLIHAVPLLLRVAFITSPVMYSATVLGAWSSANPLAFVTEATRDATLRHSWPDLSLLGMHFVGGVLLLMAAYRLFRRLEPRMGDFV